MPNVSLNDVSKIALSRQGKCLSKSYKNNSSKLEFICKEGHYFLKSYAKLKHQWCPVCSKHKKKTIEDMKEFAKSKGWRCLSNKYLNNRTDLKWKCEDGHEWFAPFTRLQKGSVCPLCAFGKSERICRAYFEKLFNKKFPKSKPSWLINNQGNKMELDGYCDKLKIAFEYHGQQHYTPVKIFNKRRNLKQQKEDDKLKRKLCAKKGILLIEIPYSVNYKNMGKFIIKKCSKAGIKVSLPKDFDYTTFKIYSRNELKRMKDIAKSHKGKCLSKSYITSGVKLKFRCKEGHEWEAVPDNIIQGHWCPGCNKPEKLNLNSFIKIAKLHGGECLSKYYINNQTKLKFKCKNKHIWRAVPAKIKYGQWCPKCSGNVRLTLEEVKNFAKSKGWDCISSFYQNNLTKLKWRCKLNGHEWIQSLGKARYRKKCPICAKEKK